MNLKSLLVLSSVLFAINAMAQNKVFSFNQVQSRNIDLQWEKSHKFTERTARFSSGNIDLRIDRNYHLNIVSTTHLPDNGVVYLCKDEKQHDITVTLIGNDKMYLYNDTKRFLIHFSRPIVVNTFKNAYADAD